MLNYGKHEEKTHGNQNPALCDVSMEKKLFVVILYELIVCILLGTVCNELELF
jgi:hypothetical protein